jgi:hypothetical protein
VALLIVSVISSLQWRYFLSVLQSHCSGVTYCCVLSHRVICLFELLILFPTCQCIFEARQLRYSCLLLSVVLVRERTIPTERPPPVGDVSANFCGERGVTWSAQRIPTTVNRFSRPGASTFLYSSSSSIDLPRLSGPRSRPTTTQKIW